MEPNAERLEGRLERELNGSTAFPSEGFGLLKVTLDDKDQNSIWCNPDNIDAKGQSVYAKTCTPFTESCDPTSGSGSCHPWQTAGIKKRTTANSSYDSAVGDELNKAYHSN